MSTISTIATSCPQLSSDDLSAIEAGISESAAEYVEFGRGDLLDPSAKRDENLWIVISGNFVVYIKDVFVSEIGPGSLIGEQAYVEHGPGSEISISADRKSAALRINRKNWERLMNRPDQCKAWGRLMVFQLSRKLATTTAMYVDHVNAEVEKERLLKMFVSEFSLGHVKAFLHGDVSSYKAVHALIFFSDIEGFSKQVASLDPDEAGRVTRALLQVQADRLRTAGAQIDKFMGDGIMSYWIENEPQLSGEIAAVAVEATLSILAELKKVSRNLGLDVGIRIGLHFGDAIAGNFGCDGRIAHTLIGSAVNLAARYEQVRSADGPRIGPIRISPAVFNALPHPLQEHFEGPYVRAVKHEVYIPLHHGPV